MVKKGQVSIYPNFKIDMSFGNNNRHVKCYYCKRLGHTISKCWYFNQRAQPKLDMCFYCKKVGHKVAECFYLRRNVGQQPKTEFKPTASFPQEKGFYSFF